MDAPSILFRMKNSGQRRSQNQSMFLGGSTYRGSFTHEAHTGTLPMYSTTNNTNMNSIPIQPVPAGGLQVTPAEYLVLCNKLNQWQDNVVTNRNLVKELVEELHQLKESNSRLNMQLAVLKNSNKCNSDMGQQPEDDRNIQPPTSLMMATNSPTNSNAVLMQTESVKQEAEKEQFENLPIQENGSAQNTSTGNSVNNKQSQIEITNQYHTDNLDRKNNTAVREINILDIEDKKDHEDNDAQILQPQTRKQSNNNNAPPQKPYEVALSFSPLIETTKHLNTLGIGKNAKINPRRAMSPSTDFSIKARIAEKAHLTSQQREFNRNPREDQLSDNINQNKSTVISSNSSGGGSTGNNSSDKIKTATNIVTDNNREIFFSSNSNNSNFNNERDKGIKGNRINGNNVNSSSRQYEMSRNQGYNFIFDGADTTQIPQTTRKGSRKLGGQEVVVEEVFLE